MAFKLNAPIIINSRFQFAEKRYHEFNLFASIAFWITFLYLWTNAIQIVGGNNYSSNAGTCEFYTGAANCESKNEWNLKQWLAKNC